MAVVDTFPDTPDEFNVPRECLMCSGTKALCHYSAHGKPCARLQRGECGFCHFPNGHMAAQRANTSGSKKRTKKKMRVKAMLDIPEDGVVESNDAEDASNDEGTKVVEFFCSECDAPVSRRDQMDTLRELAKDGEAQQQFELGRRYLLGEDVQQSLEKGLHWHREAAAQGHAGAQVSLGHFAQDDEEALSWYLKAAEQDDTEGLEMLALCFLTGQGVERSPEMSLQLFTMAAEKGSCVAQFRLGCMYALGDGAPQSDELSAEFFFQAASQDHEHAQVRLGECCATCRGVTQSDTDAVLWFLKAAAQGNAHAQYLLGVACKDGCGMEQSNEKAAYWFLKAADSGCPQAQATVGHAYEVGEGVSMSLTKAAEWYRKAADGGHVCAQHVLAGFYEKGYGVSQSYDEAVKWYCEAACCGNGRSLHQLVFSIFRFEWECFERECGFHHEDFDSDEDCQLALSYFKAVQNGICSHLAEEVQRRLSEWSFHYYEDHGIDVELKHLVKAAEKGDSAAQFSLGLRYEWGQGMRRNFTSAAKWVRMASELGFIEAHLKLGKWYNHGRCNMQQNFEAAAKYYHMAAKCGNVDGQVLLGTLCHEGQANLSEAEEQEAEKWFLKAAKQNDASSKKFLARFWWSRYGMAELLGSDKIGSAICSSAKESKAIDAAEQGDVESKKWLSAFWLTHHGWTERHERAEAFTQFAYFDESDQGNLSEDIL